MLLFDFLKSNVFLGLVLLYYLLTVLLYRLNHFVVHVVTYSLLRARRRDGCLDALNSLTLFLQFFFLDGTLRLDFFSLLLQCLLLETAHLD